MQRKQLFRVSRLTLLVAALTWAAANPTTAFPITDPRGAAALTNFQNIVLTSKTPNGTLPKDYYTTPLPAPFTSTAANSFNILDLKYYEIRNNINSGNAVGGGLTNNTSIKQRYLQFGIKIYF